MMERDMIDRLRKEPVRMEAADEAWLDQQLVSERQVRISELVREMPDEEPQLAWRSELSARLYATAARRSKGQRLSWLLRPALGVGAAAALAVVFMLRSDNAAVVKEFESPPPSIEQQILSAHQEASQTGQIWSTMREDRTRVAATPVVQEYQWDDLDLGTL